jgi:hypothetical protein
MKRAVIALAVLLAPAAARAGGDEQAPPIPTPGLLPRPDARPPAGGGIDEARLAAIVDRAVERALDRRDRDRGPAAAGPTGWAPPSASPQSIAAAPPRAARLVPAERPGRIAYAPVWEEPGAQYARVLVPASACRRAVGAVGERLARCGRPRARMMRLAPAAVEECAPPVRPSGQAD